MARSFKKAPGWSDNNHGKKKAKNFANRRVRHSKIIGNGGSYKKLYEQWDICDYNGRWYSKNSYWEFCKETYGSDNNGKKAIHAFYRGIGK